MSSDTLAHSGFVAIAGRPNAGKSTLLNRVVGSELSIVTPKAQTTRDRMVGILTEKQGQMVFIDTPGIHRADPGGLNEYMVQEARLAIESAHVVWYVVTPTSLLFHEQVVIENLRRSLRPETLVFLVFTHADVKKVPPAFERELTDSLKPTSVFNVSGLVGTGTQQLLDTTWEKLPPGQAFYSDADQLSDRPVRYLAAEKIREQIFLGLQNELPYGCAVDITEFDENDPRLTRIEATIYVERDSQKAIVIGQGGKMIKQLGSNARKSIEKDLLGHQCFLGLKVKVLKKWSENRDLLHRLGYTLA